METKRKHAHVVRDLCLSGIAIAAAYVAAGRCSCSTESGSGLQAEQPPPVLARERVLLAPEAGARPSTQREHAVQGDPASALPSCSVAHETNLAGDLSELAEPMLPTADGLYERTVALWDDPSFLELTADEAHALLPLDDSYAFTGTLSVASLMGGLPTREDCERAMRDAEASGLLARACLLEAEIVMLAEIPPERRGPAYASVIELAEQNWITAERDLMRRLDRVTSYRNWNALWTLWREWQK